MEGDRKYITGEELKQHNKEGDLWISIQGKVYNVSDWAYEHPGGDVALLNLAGQDVTDAFIAYHPGTAWQYLDKFFTGYYLKDFKVSETSKDYRRLASENANENEVSPEVPVGEEKEGDMNKVNEGSEEHKPQEEQDKVVRNAQEEEKPDDANSPQKKQVVQGIKKESHAAYNDVIEETKNKLLDERKNKVKALVGAFETVIDYESK